MSPDPSDGPQWTDQFRLRTRPDEPDSILDQRPADDRPIEIALRDQHFRALMDKWNDLLQDFREYLISSGPRGPEDTVYEDLVDRIACVRGQLKVWRDDWTFKT